MYSVENGNQFRINIINKINSIVKNKKISNNIEICIYNFTIKKCDAQNIKKKWDNPEFITIYVDRFRSLYININNPSTNMLKNIKKKKITYKTLEKITHQEMNKQKWDVHVQNKIKRDKNMTTVDMSAATDQFTCYKCRSNKCTYYQLQTRSADEPMTTFINCLNCGNRWKS